ncbi:MAG: hypothetical protein ACJ0Q8_08420 [Candidatus Azotimanducaceae bacterium]|jgi:hypothetical protein
MSEPEKRPPEQKFYLGRLLGFIFVVFLTVAIAAAIIDWAVIGPLEGRAL